MNILVVLAFILVSRPCTGRAVDDAVQKESVVSVYTTQPTTAGVAASPDVYHQIASNIAERITSPIYRFLGIGTNKTELEKTTKRPWDKIELLDEVPEVARMKPVDNDISVDRDIEELSTVASKKEEKKPEKITLYSSYLPSQKLENNNTDTKLDDDDEFDFDFDDEEEEKPREGPFVYILELLGSFVQLLWGGLSSLFKPST